MRRSADRLAAGRTDRAAVVLALSLALLPGSAAAQTRSGAGTIWEGVYTAEQVERGGRLAQANCLKCHSTREWSSGRYLGLWTGRPILEMYEGLRSSMPYDDPGRLAPEEYANLVAYLLSLNGVPAGTRPLGSDGSRLADILVSAAPDAPGAARIPERTAVVPPLVEQPEPLTHDGPAVLAVPALPPFDAVRAIAGASDVQVQAGPDSRPRSMDAVGVARRAQAAGMRALVLENHWEPTAGMAWLVRTQVPGIEVFGGIVLNATVGGVNPAAVEHMTRVAGGWGRVVWMPTYDAENQSGAAGGGRPFVAVSGPSPSGIELRPEVKEVIRLVAEHGLVLATGHSSPDESLAMLRYGREQGVRRMVVTHAMFPPVGMTVAQMKEAAAEGAWIEFPAGAATGAEAETRAGRVAQVIRQVGAGHSILSSGLGQIGAPPPPDGFGEFLVALHERGFSEEELALMAEQNPALLLGLPLNRQLPAPYEVTREWGTLPGAREWGPTGGAHVGRDGRSVWVIDRCGTGTCTDSDLAPVIQLDSAGRVLRSFGERLFVFPHGLHVDSAGNVWVTDARGAPEGDAGSGRGNRVIKFSPEGEVLMVIGDGTAGDPPHHLTEPNAAITAPNGDIFVAESHSENGKGRITKWAPDGTFLKSWGSRGTGRGQFIVPHSLAMDSQGRLFVGDRMNYRIQIFDQQGNWLDEWKQFGQPSGIYIDADDVLYVTDSHSWGDDARADGEDWRKGIRIGSARTGYVRYFIPDLESTTRANSGAEGITADVDGNVYSAIVRRHGVEKQRPSRSGVNR